MNKIKEIKDYIDSVNKAADRASERSYINKIYSEDLNTATKVYNESIDRLKEGEYTDIEAYKNYKDDFIAAYSAYNVAINAIDNI